ncbi:reverse transcriptase domain-containing protein [Tanacetum coccineum]
MEATEGGNKPEFHKKGLKKQAQVTDGARQLRKQIDEIIKAGKLSQFIKELKQNDKPKAPKKGDTTGKERPLAILMIQPWEKVAKQKAEDRRALLCPNLYVDEGASTEILYGHCFVRLRPEIRSQMVPPTTYLTGFGGETIWPLGQISLLVKIVEGGTVTKYEAAGSSPIECDICSPDLAHGPQNYATLLGQNLDVFAWKPADMTGVPRSIAEHRLNIREGCPPVRQKKRGQAPERNKAIQEEVEKLVDAGIMKEVHYHSWLSNPVMVKKHDGTWRMCVDFKDLNNACPKDCYPLPEIDWKIESLCGYPFKCFLDAYKGYHQIKMAKEDEEKTAFTTNQGIFCYSKMPFGLKNAGATYQRLVDKAFQRQIGRNLEVYVDDLVIKSRTEEEIIRDITETFKTLRQINMKLNKKKCSFRMQEGMFLGYKVNTDGLKVCPEKADAVLSLPSLRCLKDVQKLNGKLASLNRFLSKSAEKSLPFFKTLKKCTKNPPPVTLHNGPQPTDEEPSNPNEEAHRRINATRNYGKGRSSIVYLAAAKEAISAVLMTDMEGKQVSVYFVSQISGRMLKWKFELEGYDIQYRPRTAIKGQILADFIVERLKEESPDEFMTEPEELPEP